jgi:thiamine pyrophosphate-dependent acetolactate synthase large subunit-like protein
MPVFYISASARYRADALTALRQINACITNSPKLQHIDTASRLKTLQTEHKQRMDGIAELAKPRDDGMVTTAYLTKRLKDAMPEDSVVMLEAVTQTVTVANQLRCSAPGTIFGSGAGGRRLPFAPLLTQLKSANLTKVGWFGGAALGAKLGLDNGKPNSGKFVAAIVGDGTFLFAVPASVYWISRRYCIPFLTIVLNNDGWHAPLRSAKLVHPDGYAASATNEELNISFKPSPDYVCFYSS